MMKENFPNGQLHAVHLTIHFVVKKKERKESGLRLECISVSQAVAKDLAGQDPGKGKFGVSPWYEPMADIIE